MKKLLLLIAASQLFGSCSPAEQKPTRPATGGAATNRTPWHFHKLHKLFVTGNFDGDQRLDTVYQHTLAALTGTELDSCPDPMHHDWDAIAGWLANQQAEVALTLNKPGTDTLRLGSGQGLYCLLNIGDTNADGRDELALVVDRDDFTRLNSCQIATRCQGRWRILKQFSINEAAFDIDAPADSLPHFTHIEGFLLKRGQKWFYTDYLQATQDTSDVEDAGQLQELRPGKCN